MAKAHKNADFVLGDGCREPSSAHRNSALPATNPAECIWQQYARQQIAATCRQDLPAAHTTVHAAVALPPRNYRKKLPPCATAGTPTPRTTYLPCMLPQLAAKTYLPLILPCIPPDNLPAAYTTVQTAVKLPQKATAVALPPACLPPDNLPAGHTTARWVLPRDGSRAQRAGDSDVGANDQGAGDDPSDGVDAH